VLPVAQELHIAARNTRRHIDYVPAERLGPRQAGRDHEQNYFAHFVSLVDLES
jgi:hypothetical protein